MIVVATDAEVEIAKKRFPKARIVCTGVGGANVYEALKDYAKDTEIINYGYAGSNMIPVGVTVTVGKCKLYHPNVEYNEKIYELGGDYPCYTAGDFVLETKINEPCVFDMELAYILAMGFTNVKSIKIISDSLNLEEYERSTSNG